MPLVSVIVPTYRRATLLAETLDSVAAQTYRDFEVIVVEDGSHEAREVVARYDDRFRYLWQENQGLSGTRNTGAAAARGDWLAFIDDDDLWRPEKLARQVDRMRSAPDAVLIHTDHVTLIDGVLSEGRRLLPHDQVPSGRVLGPLFLGNFIIVSSVLLKREAFERAGRFVKGEIPEDYDLWLRVARFGAIEFVDEPLTVYRDHPSMSNGPWLGRGTVRVLEECLASTPEVLHAAGRAAVRKRMHEACWSAGYGYFLADQPDEAAPLFAKAWRWKPASSRSLVYAVAALTGRRGVSALRAAKRALQ
jgi:glycosyltransferase involved in cell wall biosynthesis